VLVGCLSATLSPLHKCYFYDMFRLYKVQSPKSTRPATWAAVAEGEVGVIRWISDLEVVLRMGEIFV
jgi:hypothetical protein